jgi:hypothetical protein
VVLLANGVMLLADAEPPLPPELFVVAAALTLADDLELEDLDLADDFLLVPTIVITFTAFGVDVEVQYQALLASAQAWPSLAVP